MIKYAKFFSFLKDINISQFSLIKDHGISPNHLHLMRCNRDSDPVLRTKRGIRTFTLIKLCEILNCRPDDIIEQDIVNDDELRKTVFLARSEEH